MRIIPIATLLLLVHVPARTWAQEAASPTGEELARRIDEFNAHFDAANRLSGVLLIARGDEIVLHRAYGLAHVGLGVPNRLDTPIGVASINKMMTACLWYQLVEDGKLAPEAPVARWLNDFPRGDQITLGHLASHTAGIRHRVTAAAQEATPLSAADVTQLVADSTLVSEPGAARNYSSAGFTVLARCMELATEQSFEQLLRRYVFDPAGMQHSFEKLPGREIPGAAASYVPGRGELWPAPLKDLSFLAGAGSVFSTAEDLLRFLQAAQSGRLGATFAAQVQQRPVTWTGASNGYFAFIDVHRDANLTCIWVGNSWGSCASALRAALPAICRGETVTPTPPPALASTPPTVVLAQYVGHYATGPGGSYEVRILGDELWIADSMLLAIGEDRFWHQPWLCEIQFIRDAENTVTAAERRDASSTVRWARQ